MKITYIIIYIFVFLCSISIVSSQYIYPDHITIDDFEDGILNTSGIWNNTIKVCGTIKEFDIHQENIAPNGDSCGVFSATRIETYKNASWDILDMTFEGDNRYPGLGIGTDRTILDISGETTAWHLSAYRKGYFVNIYGGSQAAAGRMELYKDNHSTLLGTYNVHEAVNSQQEELYNITMILNSSGVHVYVNDTIAISSTDTTYSEGFVWFSSNSFSGRGTNFSMDKVTYLSLVAINFPIVSILSPVNNTKNLSQLITAFNYSHADMTGGNCSLLVNGTLHGGNVSADNNEIKKLNTTALAEGYHEYFINCIDDAGLETNSTTRLYRLDSSSPQIIQGYPKSDNSTSLINPNSIIINTNFTDNLGLYIVEINITHTNGSLFYNISNNISHIPSYDFNDTINTTFWENTTYDYKVRVCDFHTKNIIDDAKNILISSDYIEYDFDGTLINIKSFDSDIDTITTKKDDDRYSFDFSYNKADPFRYYYLSSDKPIVYISSSPYKGHFIINNEYWIDFEGDGLVTVEKWINNEWKIKVISQAKKLSFNSIGELNCNEAVYLFELTGEIIAANVTVGYSEAHINETGWFNMDALDTKTTAGALMWFFVFFLLVGLVILAEHILVPAIMVLVGILGMFYGFLIYGIISSIIGVFIIVIFFGYMIRGFVGAND